MLIKVAIVCLEENGLFICDTDLQMHQFGKLSL